MEAIKIRKVSLSKNEWRVLRALADMDTDRAYYFRTIARQAHMRLRDTRLCCRSLARKGLTEYQRALVDDDGKMAGSGYSVTQAGIDMFEEENTDDLPGEPML